MPHVVANFFSQDETFKIYSLSSFQICYTVLTMGFPGNSVVKNPPDNAGDTGLIPGSGRSSGERNSNPLQYSCLRNPMNIGAWRATVHVVTRVRND